MVLGKLSPSQSHEPRSKKVATAVAAMKALCACVWTAERIGAYGQEEGGVEEEEEGGREGREVWEGWGGEGGEYGGGEELTSGQGGVCFTCDKPR